MKTGVLACVIIFFLITLPCQALPQSLAANDDTARELTGKTNDDAITQRESDLIRKRAEYMVKEFWELLSGISKGVLDINEVEEIIVNSYSDEKRKIFYDSATIIEDDIRAHRLDNGQKYEEKPIHSYLRDFDLYYKKSDTSSIVFSDFQISNVKKDSFYYVKVFYNSLFTNKSKVSDSAYLQRKRVAELKIEKQDNRWLAWIINVHFMTAADSANVNMNDVAVVRESDTSQVIAQAEPVDTASLITVNTTLSDDPVQRETARQKAEFQKDQILYNVSLEKAYLAFNASNYSTALQFYTEASRLRPNEEEPRIKIAQIKKILDQSDLTTEQQYDQFFEKALLAENQRRYDEAKQNYQYAITKNPQKASELNPKIAQLTAKIRTIAQLNAKYNAGSYKDAIKDYKAAIDKDKNNSDYYVGRGKCYEKLKDVKQAMKDYSKAISLDPNHLEAYLLRGALNEQQRKYADALADYTVASTIDRSDVAIFVKIADLNRADNPSASVAALDKAILLDSTKAMLFHKKGELLLDLKNSKEAVENFSTAIRKDSAFAPSYYFRGLARLDLNKIEDAGSDFEQARKHGIDSLAHQRIRSLAEEFYTPGATALNKSDYQGAIAAISNAILVNPYSDEYRFSRGESFYGLGDYPNAIINYTDAINLNGSYYKALFQRGMAKYALKQYREGILDFEKAAKIEIKLAPTYKYVGDGYFKLQDYRTAIRKYDTTLAVARSTKKDLDKELLADLFNNRGESYYQTGDYAKALENFRDAANNNKTKGEIFYNRGKTLLKLNQLGAAEEDLNKAMSMGPGRPEWSYSLGQMYQLKGQHEKAISEFTNALSADSSGMLRRTAVYERAQSYTKTGMYLEALKDYQEVQAQQATADKPGFFRELGNIYLELNQPDSALAAFSKVLERDPKDGEVFYGMAVAFVQKKEVDYSLPWFEKAFLSGKVKRAMVNKDKRITEVRNSKPFKALMKKYF